MTVSGIFGTEHANSAYLTPELLDVSRNEMAHTRAARAIDAVRKELEAKMPRLFEEMTVALEEELAVNKTEMRPRFSSHLTEAYQDFLAKRQVAAERAKGK